MRTRLPHLQPILSSPINWDEIEQQYDETVKYAAAMQTKTADPEAILRRFSRSEVMHPTYKALRELGRAVKTIFLTSEEHTSELTFLMRISTAVFCLQITHKSNH